MAISDRVLGYLGSTRNIVGSGAGLVGLAGTVTTGLAGSWWPVVVGGLYGIGALLAPGERRPPLRLGDSGQEQLQAAADGVAELQRRRRRGLPAEVDVEVDRVCRTVASVVQDVEQHSIDIRQLYVLARIVDDYIPTALDRYGALTPELAHRQQLAGGVTAVQELQAQITLLREETDSIAAAVFAGDAQALADHGRFLREKFGGSALDLP